MTAVGFEPKFTGKNIRKVHVSGDSASCRGSIKIDDGRRGCGGFKIEKSAKLLYTLMDPNPQAKEYFGWSVWLSEQTVGVGAPGETANGFVRAGYAYTFSDQNGSLISTYVSSNAWTDGSFGSSITVVQGPHFPGYIIAISAPNENVSGDIASGNAYVQLNSTS